MIRLTLDSFSFHSGRKCPWLFWNLHKTGLLVNHNIQERMSLSPLWPLVLRYSVTGWIMWFPLRRKTRETRLFVRDEAIILHNEDFLRISLIVGFKKNIPAQLHILYFNNHNLLNQRALTGVRFISGNKVELMMDSWLLGQNLVFSCIHYMASGIIGKRPLKITPTSLTWPHPLWTAGRFSLI